MSAEIWHMCMGTWSEHVCMGLVCACIETEWVWGPGVSVQDGPHKRAGVGT